MWEKYCFALIVFNKSLTVKMKITCGGTWSISDSQVLQIMTIY